MDGKHAFVTGGGSGIGLGIARALGRRGAAVMLADIDAVALEAAVAELAAAGVDAAAVRCDVADPSSVQAAADEMIERFGTVHVVVNNAGVSLGGAPGEIPLADWRWIVDINLLGVVYGVETFLPLMVAQGEGGHIVNTASMAGHWAAPGLGPYTATKFAVVGYSESLRHELDETDIGVSVLCPGFVATGIHTSPEDRPSGGEGASDLRDEETFAAVAALIEGGLSPDVVGEWVAACIEADRFYVFTHPDMRALIDARHDTIRADYDAADRWFAAR